MFAYNLVPLNKFTSINVLCVQRRSDSRYRTTVLEQRSHHVVVAVDECTKSLKREYFCQYFISENIHRELWSFIIPAVYLLNNFLLSESRYSARVMQKM